MRPGLAVETAVVIPAGRSVLDADLNVPLGARGVVLFAHGSGSGRFSTRNRHVAQRLNDAALATVLADLLTREEEAIDEQTREFRFDIELLSQRVVAAIEWLDSDARTSGLRIGLFGASTGAGAALRAAAERPDKVHAVVSRGGRPDLAGDALSHVHAPTLLIVGGNDQQVAELNRVALRQMRGLKELVIVPRATHLFEEAGALDEVARLAREWFVQYL